MVTKLYRIIRYGFQNFWRNRMLSAATLSVVLLALLVSESLILFNVTSKTAITTLQEKIDVIVYFNTEASEDDILGVKRSLEGLQEVKVVEYVSRERALQEFQTRHEEDTLISRSLTALGTNPLSASLKIKAYDPNEYGSISESLKQDTFTSLISKVSYEENKVVIDRLAKFVDYGRIGGAILTIVLAAIAVLVVLNTIYIAIYSNREELGIMRLVGASNAFVRGPYIFEGILYGLIGAVFSLIIMAPVAIGLSSKLSVFIPGMDLAAYFNSHIFNLLGWQIIFGVGIGVISSYIATRRYLRI
ncbi:MAG: hypothetical protein A3H06_01170 [Candidatus Colwellbacteria bacterium RIFCSPLOWO2_12_FULL_44_13]|uniref:Cell division protein FtsX n=2 Tax=Candidatus Colwelliibacteriota TaxID=1817904 RepID=A0A1G1Z8W6_9BACT|nr:MAG: hypothetical protein A3I31_02930 [Candidatus Colwellbacteria bacterium RIFCSPLOWO2_02_FULL_44_20b]OGY61448.1 MAG: hypothetical protein A3H06_01170 [Candidatus Colwellbacteria bacterium RIFCSPLOWO2_12_FULL_44_13]